MEYPKRKHTRLKEYDYSTVGTYFITICIKDEKIILSDVVGRDDLGTPSYEIKLTQNGEIAEKYIKMIPEKYNDIILDNYVIMPDHIHLLLSLNGASGSSRPTASISKIIGALKRLINKETGKNIFQASFYDHVIRNENDYIIKYNYIANNPVRWGEKYCKVCKL